MLQGQKNAQDVEFRSFSATYVRPGYPREEKGGRA